jgi:hypothetical protein
MSEKASGKGIRLKLEGMAFGAWTVLDEVHVPDRSGTYWRCVCACGTVSVLRGASLVNGRTHGCQPCHWAKIKWQGAGVMRKDMTGLTVGDWTVLRRCVKPRSSGAAYWVCRCVCGEERSVRGSALRAGTTSRCPACAAKKSRRKNNDERNRT